MNVSVSEKLLQEAISYIRKIPCNCIKPLKVFNVPIIYYNKKICPPCKLVKQIEGKIHDAKRSLYKH